MQFHDIKQLSIQDAQQLRQHLEEEIADFTAKLDVAKLRQKQIQRGQAQPRNQSRRSATPLETLKDALREIDSYIFTLEFKLKQHREKLGHVAKLLQNWERF